MDESLDALDGAVGAHDAAAARGAALDVSLSATDLAMQQSPAAAVDVARMRSWARRVAVDVEATDAVGVLSDVALIESIWARVAHTGAPDVATVIGNDLTALRAASDAHNLSAAGSAAAALVAHLPPAPSRS